VLKECWSIYTLDSHDNNKDLTWFHKQAGLKLAKECNEALFKLAAEGPSVIYVKLLEERLSRIEARQIRCPLQEKLYSYEKQGVSDGNRCINLWSTPHPLLLP
jgi:hypothetical protein